ncbi:MULTISPECIES: L-glutamate gamma-semialdehyde dehydrogenase [Flavobacterium]|jgi:1-pyrroline-5-carboxylate dehydrogenase|uniref:L-glutamate gamma-semialdehyde dehydrogenase n=1 Tax=Flavobacterium TaxID=237 RepID=UPI000B11C4E2|nr:L-glutamate gamma-semialdehyde dehydrogenase [Flavobacterium johnsoniae]MBX9806512.1 L-glutamate gamma-semialdehyde dehydrogenase [Flavobacteriaceae bacterium]
MANAYFTIKKPFNEPVKNYEPGSSERKDLLKALNTLKTTETKIPMYIGGKEVISEEKSNIYSPHDHNQYLGYFYKSSKEHITQAINAALEAREKWVEMPWEQRATIFLKAADLMAGKYRATLNAATILGQSKTIHQSEIDSVCESVDFLRFNSYFMSQLYQEQPESSDGVWNRMEWRPLEGFIYALTPFNFTSIACNLPTSCALMGNVVVWKPSNSQVYTAKILMDIYREAGIPDGVINLIYPSGPDAADVIFEHPDFSGIHFTGSTGVFQNIWKTIGTNIHKYKSYPRIVGETGGKDFIVAHNTANIDALVTAIIRGSFEYQGQKCSASSRAYIPKSIWPTVKDKLIKEMSTVKMGSPEDFTNFMSAVIDQKSYDKLSSHIEAAKNNPEIEVVFGGEHSNEKGYFIQPTIILTKDPKYVTMCEELFGPLLTIHVYDDLKFEEILDIVNSTSIYALTGAFFADDREIINIANKKLTNAAGNFYINDKPTGAVVGQQPFGGARGSGTNDKAGSKINLLRWTSARTIKENYTPPTNYRYPFMNQE